MGRSEIESLMKARADMKMSNLRQQFVLTMFKPDMNKQSVKQQKEMFLMNLNKEVEKNDAYLSDGY